MRLASTLVLLACGCALLSGQQAPPNKLSDEDVAALRSLQAAAMKSDYAMARLEHLTDSIGPRISGSPQKAAANEYVAAELRKLGLEVRLQEVTVPHWVRGDERAELVAYPGQAAGTVQRLAVTALGMSAATPPEGITADVVAVRSFDELERLGRERVAGKIVVFNQPFNQRMVEAGQAGEAYGESVAYREEGAVAASRLGAAASLIRSVGGAVYRLPHTGLTSYRKGVPVVPAGALSTEDAALVERLARRGPVRLHLVLTPSTLPAVIDHNVIGDLKGSERPEEVVVVSGHLDSWDLGTGAIDDGVGVAVAMEAANLVKQLGLRPKRTIRVVAWAAEEPGLEGARRYARDFAGELGRHARAIEMDLGAGHPIGFAFENGKSVGLDSTAASRGAASACAAEAAAGSREHTRVC
jgi:Zn-dependent M28 family amino/carboxypeptidase